MSQNKITSLEPLPLDDAWTEIEAALKTHRNLVLVAEPGAGKTTRFPPRLLRSGFVPGDQKILMLEPRRLAARASASRIADEQGWTLGGEVGYQVRFENRTSPATRLHILTEGLLARRLRSDDESDTQLSGVGAVILDEFHERSVHTDLAIGLLVELQELARPDLRLIVMSATLDAERVAAFLGNAPIVRVPGRTHPVEIHHAKRPLMLDTGPSFLDAVAESTLDVLEGSRPRSGDVLVFLPGAREIRGVRERIADRAARAGFDCLELHGSLALEDQDRALRKHAGRSRVVLATNIAETSLTLDGIGTVIDSGLARVMRVDALGFARLQVSRISLASAIQRAGRAGRQGPGHCHRLWNRLDESSMSAFEQPEILRADLTEPLITLLAQGLTDPEGFTWFEKPTASALTNALQTLTDLGFRDRTSGALTNEGRESLKLPLPVRPARLVLEAIKAGTPELGARLAALLSERDIVLRAADLKQRSGVESDILLRLHLLNRGSERSFEIDRIAARNVEHVASAIESSARRVVRQRLNSSSDGSNGASNNWVRGLDGDEIALRLLLLGFPDRVARRRRPKDRAARLVGGRGVTLAPFSTVEMSDLFLALDSSEPPPSAASGPQGRTDAQISIASRIDPAWIETHYKSSLSSGSRIVFDDETLSVQKQTALSFRDLPLEEAKISRPSTDEAFEALMTACLERWETHFLAQEDLAQLLARLRFLQVSQSSSSSDPELEFDAEEARRSFLEEVCFGETRLSSVLSKPLAEAYLRHLPSPLSTLLREAAPEALTVPSGSRIRVHYPDERAPYIEVRIQEVFGWTASPRIARGRIPVQLHLLGPNFRPVQVTSDLESFWRNGYAEVRKELRARYPKHSWPEDPLTAKAEAKGRPRR